MLYPRVAHLIILSPMAQGSLLNLISKNDKMSAGYDMEDSGVYIHLPNISILLFTRTRRGRSNQWMVSIATVFKLLQEIWFAKTATASLLRLYFIFIMQSIDTHRWCPYEQPSSYQWSSELRFQIFKKMLNWMCCLAVRKRISFSEWCLSDIIQRHNPRITNFLGAC